MHPVTTLFLVISLVGGFVATTFLPDTPVGQAANVSITWLTMMPLLWRLDTRPDRAKWMRRMLAMLPIYALLMIPLTMWGKTWSPRTTEVSTLVFFSGAGTVALTTLVWQHFFRRA
jgi:hypothetical protein